MWGIIGTLLNSIGGTFLKYFWRKQENERIADSVHAKIEIENLEKSNKGLRARDALNRLKWRDRLLHAKVQTQELM